MNTTSAVLSDTTAADRHAVQTMAREKPRLRNWLRRNLASVADVEDVLQDLFVELVLANRAACQIEDVGAWLFTVARNRLVDLFRRDKRNVPAEVFAAADDDEGPPLAELLPDDAAGPEAAYARSVLVEHLAQALAELPTEQREAFLAHEFEGESFAGMSARTGVGINTLLARKQYAVRKLRQTLAAIYQDHLSD